MSERSANFNAICGTDSALNTASRNWLKQKAKQFGIPYKPSATSKLMCDALRAEYKRRDERAEEAEKRRIKEKKTKEEAEKRRKEEAEVQKQREKRQREEELRGSVERIRRALLLNIAPWNAMPDAWIEAAFRPSSSAELKKQYGLTNNESLEFLGDALLQFLSTKLLFDKARDKNLTPHYATHARSMLVRNTTLTCLMNNRSLCQYAACTGSKCCADALEALIGALYWHRYVTGAKDPVGDVENWLHLAFDFDSLTEKLLAGDWQVCRGQRATEIEVPDYGSEESGDSEEVELLGPSTILAADPRLEEKLRRYATLFAEGIPSRYEEDDYWDEALSLANELEVLPVRSAEELTEYRPLNETYAKLKQLLSTGDPNVERGIRRLFGERLSERETPAHFLSSGEADRPSIRLRVAEKFDLFPELHGLSFQTPGALIQSLLKRARY